MQVKKAIQTIDDLTDDEVLKTNEKLQIMPGFGDTPSGAGTVASIATGRIAAIENPEDFSRKFRERLGELLEEK